MRCVWPKLSAVEHIIQTVAARWKSSLEHLRSARLRRTPRLSSIIVALAEGARCPSENGGCMSKLRSGLPRKRSNPFVDLFLHQVHSWKRSNPFVDSWVFLLSNVFGFLWFTEYIRGVSPFVKAVCGFSLYQVCLWNFHLPNTKMSIGGDGHRFFLVNPR